MKIVGIILLIFVSIPMLLTGALDILFMHDDIIFGVHFNVGVNDVAAWIILIIGIILTICFSFMIKAGNRGEKKE